MLNDLWCVDFYFLVKFFNDFLVFVQEDVYNRDQTDVLTLVDDQVNNNIDSHIIKARNVVYHVF